MSKLDETALTAIHTHQMILLNAEGDQFIAVGDNYLFSDVTFPRTGLNQKNDTDSVNVHQNKVVKKIYQKFNDFVKFLRKTMPT